MKSLSVITLVLIALIGLNAQESWAAGPIDIGAEVGIQSKYVWRGFLLTDGPVLQPSVTLGLKGLDLNLWGNMDLGENDIIETKDSMEMNEIDYTLSYNRSLLIIDASVGVIHYTFPNMTYDSATTEVFAGISGSFPGHPSITLYRDVQNAEGTYISIGAGQSIPVGLLFGIEISGAIGLGSKNYSEFYSMAKEIQEINDAIANEANKYKIPGKMKNFTPTDIMLGISVPIGIGELVNITPSITYTGIINGDISDFLELQSKTQMISKTIDDHNVYFGLTASVNF